MSSTSFALAVIIASVREGRFGPVVADWFVGQAKQRNDAFVVVTPEYNHGYPGPLKTAIDSVGREWHAKPVGFVCYGGLSGGLRAVEQLRIVFASVPERKEGIRCGCAMGGNLLPKRLPPMAHPCAAIVLPRRGMERWLATASGGAPADRA